MQVRDSLVCEVRSLLYDSKAVHVQQTKVTMTQGIIERKITYEKVIKERAHAQKATRVDAWGQR